MNEYICQLEEIAQNCNSSQQLSLAKLQQEFFTFRDGVLESLRDIENSFNKLEMELDNHEMYSRRNCLLIHGISETPNENVDVTVSNFVASMNIKSFNFCVNTMVDRCHRIGRRADPASNVNDNKCRPIIVKFTSYRYRSVIGANKKLLKKTKKVLTESLTVRRYNLYKAAQTKYGMKSVWTSDGNVNVILPDATKMRIRCVDDLTKMRTRGADDLTAEKEITIPPIVRSSSRNATSSTSGRGG